MLFRATIFCDNTNLTNLYLPLKITSFGTFYRKEQKGCCDETFTLSAQRDEDCLLSHCTLRREQAVWEPPALPTAAPLEALNPLGVLQTSLPLLASSKLHGKLKRLPLFSGLVLILWASLCWIASIQTSIQKINQTASTETSLKTVEGPKGPLSPPSSVGPCRDADQSHICAFTLHSWVWIKLPACFG